MQKTIEELEVEIAELQRKIDGMEDDPTPEKSEHCKDRKRCLREINPKVYPGVFFGDSFQYDRNYFGCYLCDRESCLTVSSVIQYHREDGDYPSFVTEEGK